MSSSHPGPPSDSPDVAHELHSCPVCGLVHEVGSSPFETRLHPVDGEPPLRKAWGLCPEHQRYWDDDYVALIEIDPSRTPVPHTFETAYRTGNIALLRRPVAEALFEQPCPTPIVLIELGVLDIIKERLSTSTGGSSQ